jgi:transcriptional regulator with XRE-family HTH domain
VISVSLNYTRREVVFVLNTFGKRLKEIRIERGLRQEDIGAIVHVGKSTVSQWENNVHVPDIETIAKIASHLNVSIDYLLGRTDIRNPDQPDEDIIAFLRAAEGLTEDEKREVLAYIEFRKAQRRKAAEEKKGKK